MEPINPNFQPNEESHDLAKQLKVNITLEHMREFIVFWTRNGASRADWQLEFQNQIRYLHRKRATQQPHTTQTQTEPTLSIGDWAKTILAYQKHFNADANRVAPTFLTPEEKTPLNPDGPRPLAEIHRVYSEAWNQITNEMLKELEPTIAKAAEKLEEGDRGHFRFLASDQIRSLCGGLAQAVANRRERPPFPYDRIDWDALARRTESQLHSTAGYEGRKNLSWWERRYGAQVAAVENVPRRPPAPEMVWENPNSGWRNPNK